MPRKASRKKRNVESINQRRNISKRLKRATKLDIISASALNATPLLLPPPTIACTASTRVQPQQYVQLSLPNESNDNSKIVINNVEIPSLCGDIERKEVIEEALEYLTRTRVQPNPSSSPSSPQPPLFSTEKHRACICVICDSFIIGTEEIVWLSKDRIKNKSSYLSVGYYQREVNRGVEIPQILRDQYVIENDDDLKDLLLSPRAHRRGDTYMSCKCCATNIKRNQSLKPPRFGISNGWLIGFIPQSVVDDIDDMLASMISHVRFFPTFSHLLQEPIKPSKATIHSSLMILNILELHSTL